MVKEVQRTDYLAQKVAERRRQLGDAAPEFYWHYDPTLPEAGMLMAEALPVLVDAMLDWGQTAGRSAVCGIAIWRGHREFGDAPGDLAVEVARFSGKEQRAPDADGGAAAALGRLETEVARLGLAAPTVTDGVGAERRLVRLPLGLPQETSQEPRWGHAFERRRLLVLRHPIMSGERMRRSLSSSSLVTDFVPEPRAAREAVLARAKGEAPYDFAVMNAGVLGDALADTVEGLREAAGDTDLRIVVSGASSGHGAIAGVDRLILHDRPERLMDVLFEVVRQPSHARGAPAETEVPSLIGRHLLIVEDVAMNRALLQAMLAPTGATLEVASNGAEAVKAVAARKTHLVLMDIQLPVLDGLEATRRIRAQGRTLPIIALTANARETDRALYLGAGMDGYLAKPIRVDDLYAVLRNVLTAVAGD
ncbi:MAG: response regulator [Pseudomonadota bacterium]